MTRSPGKLEGLPALGAEPVLCDVYDAALRAVVLRRRPHAVMHQITDPPDDAEKIPLLGARNARMVREGTRSLYGRLHGPGTYFETQEPALPRTQIDEAARRTVEIRGASPGILQLVESQLTPAEPHHRPTFRSENAPVQPSTRAVTR
jgi:hypothetical protein